MVRPSEHHFTLQRLVAEGVLVVAVFIWWIGARHLPSFVLPGPLGVLKAISQFVTDPNTALDALISFSRVVASVAIAMILALALAVAMRAMPPLEGIIERRILTFLNSFPSVGWAILGVVWFKISTPTVLFIQTAIVLPFCLINVLAGFQQIDSDLEELGTSLTRSPVRRFFKLTLPLLAPFLIAGLRIAYGICWKIALVSELFGASSGLGYLLMQAQTVSNATMVFACCIVIVMIYGVTDFLFLRPLANRFSVNQGDSS